MRSAKISDHWGKVYKRPYSFTIDRLDYKNLCGLGSGDIQFNGGITAICGANGVGKTTLLKALEGVINSNSSLGFKLEGSELKGYITNSGNTTEHSRSFANGQSSTDFQDTGSESVLIDISTHSSDMISEFATMTNLDELLEQYEEQIADYERLETLSFIIGKNYESCLTYEIDTGDMEIPYFRVKHGAITYGSETMGLGEISVHYILWQLNRISLNSVLLIEEPETFLAPRSQEALIDVLAKFSEQKGVWVILTTHSPTILKRIPIKHIRLLVRSNDRVLILVPRTELDYLYALGIPPNKTGIIFVEDHAAREFTKVWIGRFAPQLLQQLEIKDLQGEGPIRQVLSTLPLIKNWIKVIGLFDGDLRGNDFTGLNWPYCFLPSNNPPEVLLRNATQEAISQNKSICGRDIHMLTIVLSSLEGKDSHDWFIEFSKGIGVSYEQLMEALFDLLMTDKEFVTMAEDSFSGLMELL